jgi:ADP-ribosylglycohydrolase
MGDISKDKVRGCLMGVAVGDALGMPVETLSHRRIMELTGGAGVTGFLDPVQDKVSDTRRLPAGSTTDDTQLTLATACSIAARGRWDLESQARRLAKEYEISFGGIDGRPDIDARAYNIAYVGWGGTLKAGAEAFRAWFASGGKEGRHPEAPAPLPDREGVGCGTGPAMRVSPLAIVYTCGIHQEMEPFLTYVMELGRMTHGDLRASFGAAAVGAAISAALLQEGAIREENDFQLRYLRERIDCAVAVLEERFRFVKRYEDAMSARIDRAWKNLGSAESLRSATGAGFSTLEAVPLALGTFLRHPDDFRAGVLEAVNAGGDTDTVGSMVGAMIGANVGLSGIPEEWVRGVRGGDDILVVADALYDVRCGDPRQAARRLLRW